MQNFNNLAASLNNKLNHIQYHYENASSLVRNNESLSKKGNHTAIEAEFNAMMLATQTCLDILSLCVKKLEHINDSFLNEQVKLLQSDKNAKYLNDYITASKHVNIIKSNIEGDPNSELSLTMAFFYIEGFPYNKGNYRGTYKRRVLDEVLDSVFYNIAKRIRDLYDYMLLISEGQE